MNPESIRSPVEEATVHPYVRKSDEVLRRHPAPALRVRELAHALADDLGGPVPPFQELAGRLATHPDLFLLLDPWTGAWKELDPHRVRDPGDLWVVRISQDGGEPDPGAPAAALRLRRTVRWLSREVETRSAMGLARWHRLATEAAELSALLSRAA